MTRFSRCVASGYDIDYPAKIFTVGWGYEWVVDHRVKCPQGRGGGCRPQRGVKGFHWRIILFLGVKLQSGKKNAENKEFCKIVSDFFCAQFVSL